MISTNKSKLIEIIAAVFILLFAYTSISKLTDHRNFVFILKNSPFINKWASVISWSLPAVELLITLLLLIPAIRLLGLYLAFGLMIVFTAYIGLMLILATELPCSCGGVLNELSWKQHWILNIGLMLLAGFALFLEFRRLKFSNQNIKSLLQ